MLHLYFILKFLNLADLPWHILDQTSLGFSFYLKSISIPKEVCLDIIFHCSILSISTRLISHLKVIHHKISKKKILLLMDAFYIEFEAYILALHMLKISRTYFYCSLSCHYSQKMLLQGATIDPQQE